MFLLLHTFVHHKKLFFLFVFLLIVGVAYTLHNDMAGITQGASVTKNHTQMLANTLPDIENTFVTMKNNGWDVNRPLIYAYYFYDHDKNKLAAFSKVLTKEGFHIGILDKSATYDKDRQYLLYVTETTTHTPQSLLKQCNKLSDLAVKNNIEVFDGWEAGTTSLDGQSLSSYQD